MAEMPLRNAAPNQARPAGYDQVAAKAPKALAGLRPNLEASRGATASWWPVGAAVAGAAGSLRGRRLPRRERKEGQAAVETTDRWGYDQEAYVKGYSSATSEQCCSLYSEDLPKDLRGTYFKNGPAKLKVGEDVIKHPFDADGMVAAVTFDGEGHAHFRNRFVRTPGFVEELGAGQMLYRGQFSLKPGGWLANAFDMRLKHVANTGVMEVAGRLFALWEAGKPFELDPKSLATLGESDLNGGLTEEEPFTAHPRVDFNSTQFGFNYRPEPVNGVTQVSFFEFTSDLALASRVDAELPGFGFYHDFLVTENYFILSKPPIELSPQNALQAVLGFRGMGESITFDKSQPSQIVLVSRDGSGVRYVDVDTHFCFHFANGFESDGKLVVDMVRTPELSLGEASKGEGAVWEKFDWSTMEGAFRLVRYEIDESSGDWKVRELCDRAVDFPSIAGGCGKPYRNLYCATTLSGAPAPFQGLMKVDVTGERAPEIWLPEAWEFLGEVVVCPKGKEPEGYLTGILIDARKDSCDLVVFDCQKVATGPICRLPLPSFMPHALHGTFSPMVPDFEEIKAAWEKSPTSL